MITPQKNQTDDLTGLFNRRAFLEEFDSVLTMARSTHEPFSLAMLDIDRFMETNDRYGHVGGDEVLQQVARIIGESVSPETASPALPGRRPRAGLPGAGRHAFQVGKDAVHAFERAGSAWGTHLRRAGVLPH
jgi:two-component system cell cycle response regulator